MVIRDFMEYFFILSLIKSQSKTGSKFLAFNYVQVLQHKAGKSLAFPLTLCLYMGCWSIFVRLSQQLFAKVRHCDSGVSHPRKQHRDLTSLIWSPAHYLLDQCKLSAGISYIIWQYGDLMFSVMDSVQVGILAGPRHLILRRDTTK